MHRDLDQFSVTTVRTLAMDAVQKARSGHPGTAMALAPVACALWQRFLRYDPAEPIWPSQDRLVLSNGHASMLVYALLHLSGVKASTRITRRSAGWPWRWGTPEPSASSAPSAPAIPSTAGRAASRRSGEERHRRRIAKTRAIEARAARSQT